MTDIDSLRDDERRASGEPKLPETVTIPRPQYEALMMAMKGYENAIGAASRIRALRKESGNELP